MPAPWDSEPIAFEDIAGFEADDLDAAFAAFRRSARHLFDRLPQQRPARAPAAGLIRAARAALEWESGADAFFRVWFRPHRLPQQGFVTAYYEPQVEARLTPEPGFETPALSRPPDLVTLATTPLWISDHDALTSARRLPDGTFTPFPTRAGIEEGGAATGAEPIAYVRDAVELFLIQVQGSARLRLHDGSTRALTYDGRNGWPYTSIGRLMIERGIVPEGEMSLERLKAALRGMGAGPGQPGRRLMQENRSYVFFRLDDSEERRLGPIGGEGVTLTPLRSIAVDRGRWSYGLPFWISTRVPWAREEETRFERLMIAQDTGSAILGEARADLFFGTGPQAGSLAGRVRHPADFIVFLPTEDAAP